MFLCHCQLIFRLKAFLFALPWRMSSSTLQCFIYIKYYCSGDKPCCVLFPKIVRESLSLFYLDIVDNGLCVYIMFFQSAQLTYVYRSKLKLRFKERENVIVYHIASASILYLQNGKLLIFDSNHKYLFKLKGHTRLRT